MGGQGSGDGAQKDMVKLDAYARAQAKKKEEEELKAIEDAKLAEGGEKKRTRQRKRR